MQFFRPDQRHYLDFTNAIVSGYMDNIEDLWAKLTPEEKNQAGKELLQSISTLPIKVLPWIIGRYHDQLPMFVEPKALLYKLAIQMADRLIPTICILFTPAQQFELLKFFQEEHYKKLPDPVDYSPGNVEYLPKHKWENRVAEFTFKLKEYVIQNLHAVLKPVLREFLSEEIPAEKRQAVRTLHNLIANKDHQVELAGLANLRKPRNLAYSQRVNIAYSTILKKPNSDEIKDAARAVIGDYVIEVGIDTFKQTLAVLNGSNQVEILNKFFDSLKSVVTKTYQLPYSAVTILSRDSELSSHVGLNSP